MTPMPASSSSGEIVYEANGARTRMRIDVGGTEAREDGLDVHFAHGDAAVLDRLRRHGLEPAGIGVRPGDDDVDAAPV